MASYSKQWWIMDAIRTALSTIDSIIYSLISILYQIFFNVSNATLISGETIKAFYSRIQLILGILVMFKLAISLINGIMNPDSISDEKKGFFGIIKRIIIALIMLVLIVPLNIPTADLGEKGSYNSQLNNNGILFGTLYEVQSIILSQNTIARLILGVSNDVDSSDLSSTAKESGNELAVIILKSFITINVKSDDGDPMIQEDRMCQDTDSQEAIISYLDPTISTSGILNLVNEACDVGDSGGVPEIEEGEDYYVFNYRFLLSTIVGALFVLFLLGFIIDVAIRAFKLAVLRLISPLPIISYIDPKSAQNGAFSAWVKSVTTTYIDLFTRLAIIYFIIFMIQEFSINGIVMDVGTGAVGLFSKIFIILGLFFFAKEAPKFILESLGIQNKGAGLFGGLGKLRAATGGLAGSLAGAYRGGINAFRASRTATDVNDKPNSSSRWNQWVKPFGSGLFGALGSGYQALSTAASAKDHHYRRAMNKVNEMNAKRTQYAPNGSTWLGSHIDGARQAFTGMNEFDRLKREETIYKRQAEEAKGKKTTLSTIQSMAEEKAKGSTDTSGKVKFTKLDQYGREKLTYNGQTLYRDQNGRYLNTAGNDITSTLTDFEKQTLKGVRNLVEESINYNDFIARRSAAAAKGDTHFIYNNSGDQISMAEAMSESFTSKLLDSNTSNYIYQVKNSTIDDKGLKQQLDGANQFYKPTSSDKALKDLKIEKGKYASQEFNANTQLDEIRAKMPRAQSNADRSKRDIR